MKYVKMLGLLGVAAVVLMGFAGSASATTLTSPEGTVYTGELHAVSGEITLHGVKTITCGSSTFVGTVEKHGSTSTVEGNVTTLSFASCGTDDFTVVLNGKLVVHLDPEAGAGPYDGTVTSDGVTILMHVTSLGLNCGFKTENTDFGTLTSSKSTGSTAVLDLTLKIPRHSGSIFCGSSGDWTGQYSFTTPDELFVG